jgi:hypothetical protein
MAGPDIIKNNISFFFSSILQPRRKNKVISKMASQPSLLAATVKV